MARPSQAITFPEVMLAKYGNRPRANMPTEVGSPIAVDMGSDQYGWHRDAVKVANDRVNQIHSSQKMYERGARPYEKLHLRTNRGAIVPFGINGLGGKFVEPPQNGSSGELRGGIMFTKAGQDYIQELLNKRQKQYAEMYQSSSAREIPTSNTDDPTGEIALSAVYPLYDALLDDLRTLNVKSVTAFNSWWAMMLTTLPILGSNFRPQIKTIVETLGEVAQPYTDYVEHETEVGSNAQKLGRSVLLRLNKALRVMWLYIGASDQNEENDTMWDANATYNALWEATEAWKRGEPVAEQDRLPMVRGRPMTESEWLVANEDTQRNNLRHLIPQYGKSPIDAPASVREELVRKLNMEAGVSISKATENSTRAYITRLLQAHARGETEDVELRSGVDFDRLSSPQGSERLVAEAGSQNQSYDADGEFRPRTGRLSERPSQTAVASDETPLYQRLASGETVVSGQGRPRHNFQRKPTRLAEHHRLQNAHNERGNAVGSGLASDLLSKGWDFLKKNPKDVLYGAVKGLSAVDKLGNAIGYKGKGRKDKR